MGLELVFYFLKVTNFTRKLEIVQLMAYVEIFLKILMFRFMFSEKNYFN